MLSNHGHRNMLERNLPNYQIHELRSSRNSYKYLKHVNTKQENSPQNSVRIWREMKLANGELNCTNMVYRVATNQLSHPVEEHHRFGHHL
jgi:hypothetical protein